MADAITIKALQDASLDAKSLEEVVNGDEAKQVTTRKGETYPSVKKAITQMFENGGLPATPFTTKALMTASALVDDKYAMVTDDAADNGLYVKTAGAWVKSDYDPLGQSKEYVDTKLADSVSLFETLALLAASTLPEGSLAQVINDTKSTHNGFYKKTGGLWISTKLQESISFLDHMYLARGDFDIALETGMTESMRGNFINMDGAVRTAFSTPDMTLSVFREIDRGEEQVSFTAYSSGALTALYAFYTADNQYIPNTAEGGAKGSHDIVIPMVGIPEEAVYMRYTSHLGLDTSIYGVKPLIATQTTTEAIVHDVIPKKAWDSLHTLYQDTVGYINDYRLTTTGELSPSIATDGLYVSPYLEIDMSQNTIYITGWLSTNIASYAVFDRHYSVISISPTGGAASATSYNINTSDLPTGAKYIRYTGRYGYGTEISGAIKSVDILGEIKNLTKEESISGTPVNVITITGASLTYDGNTWFGLANEKLGTTAINKARNGHGRPSTDALDIWKKEFWTESEFEGLDVFAFQYANVRGLDDDSELLGSYLEYTPDYIEGAENPFSSYSEAQCLDYILKFLQAECYAQKDNPNSKWFGAQHGKPFRTMFVTHWHDGRPYYNLPIRTVAKRWGSAVCEFDKKIGFSKETPLSDGTQVSVLYAQDTTVIDGLTLGWHPKRGTDSAYIQGRMADIFSASIREWFM